MKRLTPIVGFGLPIMEPIDRGLYVLYDDAQATIASLTAELTEARAEAAAAAAVEAEARACAEICEKQAQTFSTEEYAVGQPLSSFSERFACSQIKAAILARIDQRKEKRP